MKKILLLFLMLCLLTASVFGSAHNNETHSQVENQVQFSFDFTLLAILVLTLFTILAVTTNNPVIGVITSIGISIQGLYFLLDTILLGTVTLVGGLMLALWFAIKQND